jgi:hypothetical protein
MLTRSQVAKRLDRSVATVRKMEGRVLHPTRNERGVWLFDEADVEEVARDVEVSGRALTADHDEVSAAPWPTSEDVEEREPVTTPDRSEFEQAQRRIREHRAELAALQARVELLEDEAAFELDELGDGHPSSPGRAFWLLFGAVGLGLLFILGRAKRPGDGSPSASGI